MSTEYPKINTLFERDKATFIVDPTQIKQEVLGTISKWDVTEKIDGMNIRVVWDPTAFVSSPGIEDSLGTISWDPSNPPLRFYGRTDAAVIPADLLSHLQSIFTVEKLLSNFSNPTTFYGEGYGGKIQSGMKLSPTKSFILFDVKVHSSWLKDSDMRGVAEVLGCPAVPYMGRMNLDQIIAVCKAGFNSALGEHPPAEGIVARPIEPLFNNWGQRVIIKLKTRDFVPGKR